MDIKIKKDGEKWVAVRTSFDSRSARKGLTVADAVEQKTTSKHVTRRIRAGGYPNRLLTVSQTVS
jgi:hypothetical protein